MVCQIEFPVSWQTLTGAKLDFLLCQTLSHVTCIYPCLLSMWKIYCSMILPVTAKSEDYKICKQPYITSILPTSVFVREIGISYLLPQLMKYSNNHNNILISHHQMHADHSRSSTYNCRFHLLQFIFGSLLPLLSLLWKKKQYITIFIYNNNVINSLFIFTEHRRSSVLKVTGLTLFFH